MNVEISFVQASDAEAIGEFASMKVDDDDDIVDDDVIDDVTASSSVCSVTSKSYMTTDCLTPLKIAG